jgi:hypothetical protein
MYPTSIDFTADRFPPDLTTTTTLGYTLNYPTIAVPSPYVLVGHTLDLVGADGVTYGHVKNLSVVGLDPAGDTVVSGLFTSGTTTIIILGSFTPYAGGPTSFTSSFSFEGYDSINSGLAVDFHGTLTQTYQHATVSGSLAVYYPDTSPIAFERGDKMHQTASGGVYWEPVNTHYTSVSGAWF